eukprot:7922278-Pyramimonas_sp.AAC.1
MSHPPPGTLRGPGRVRRPCPSPRATERLQAGFGRLSTRAEGFLRQGSRSWLEIEVSLAKDPTICS